MYKINSGGVTIVTHNTACKQLKTFLRIMASAHKQNKNMHAMVLLTAMCYAYLFLFKNMSISTWSGVSLVRSLFTVRPAAENTRSAGTDVPGIVRYLRARLATLGNLPSFTFHHSVGLESRSGGGGSLRKLSTSFVTSSVLLLV